MRKQAHIAKTPTNILKQVSKYFKRELSIPVYLADDVNSEIPEVNLISVNIKHPEIMLGMFLLRKIGINLSLLTIKERLDDQNTRYY